jgi:hypothetical protein
MAAVKKSLGNSSLPNFLPSLVNLGVIALFGSIALALQFPKLNQKSVGQTVESDRLWLKQEEARLQATALIPKQGFGFNNLIANWTFLGFLQYFGDDVARIKNKTGYSLSPKYFQIIINRDPRFLSSYLYLSTSVSIFAAQPRQTVNLIALGAKSLVPEIQSLAYQVWRRKGIDELLFLGDSLAASQSFVTAAEWADWAKFDPNALEETKIVSKISRETAAFLKTNPNSRAARINGWVSVLSSAIDRKTQEIAVAELDRLGITVVFDREGKFNLMPKELKKS